MKKIVSLFTLFSLLIFLVSSNLTLTRESSFGENKATKKWTIMVYVDGDNNLEEAAIDDINEMEEAGSDANINIIAQVDRIPEHDSSNGDWTNTRRYYITYDTDPNIINSTLIDDMAEQDMGNPQTLINFAAWGIQNYPADNYLLILWDHGSGWKKRVLPHKGICWDDTNSENYLTTEEMKLALKAIKDDYLSGEKIEILGMDACLMQMLEVGYEIKNEAEIMVGSEETEPGDGWPYNDFLINLKANSNFTPRELSSDIVEKYVSSYNGGSQGYDDVTLSALDLSKISDVTQKTGLLADDLILNYNVYDIEIEDARANTQSYADPDYIDLYNFTELIKEKIGNSNTQNLAQQLMNSIGYPPSSGLLIKTGNTGGSVEYSYGVSIYYPNTSYDYNYDNLSLSSDTSWNEFLKKTFQPPSPTAPLLLVDDDGAQSYEKYYANSLKNNAYSYNIWHTAKYGSPSYSNLNNWSTVVWFTGNDWNSTLTSDDQNNLEQFLNNGGALFISGQDIGYDLTEDGTVTNNFYENYLSAKYVQDQVSSPALTGADILAGISFNAYGGDGANNQIYPSEIDPASPNSMTILTYNEGAISSGSGGIKVEAQNYRLVYFSFGFEGIDSQNKRDAVLKEVCKWLGAYPTPKITSIEPNSGTNSGIVNITNLAGTKFISGALVKLTKSGQSDINASDVNVVSSNKITCKFDLKGKAAGAWNVVVTNPDTQSGALSNGFTILQVPSPAVSSITPNSGYNNQVVNITNLAGANFVSGAIVKLTKSGQSDINATNVNVVSSSKITCTLDLNGKATGAWNVVVTNPDSQYGTLANGFTILQYTPIDNQKPKGTIVINDGAEVTHLTAVNLTLSAQDNVTVTEMRIANNNSFSGSSWEAYKTTKVWTLLSGDGVKTVYAQFKDSSGLTSDIASDTIILSTKKTLIGLEGNTRYETAVEISKEGFPNGAEYVILARGDLFPDALAGAPLCAKLNSPLLLTSSESLSPATATEIQRLKASKAIILGTADAVSEKVKEDLISQCGINQDNIQRIGGDTRYDTASLIAKQLKPLADKTCFVATGENYPDALASASVAAYKKIPIMLVRGDIGLVPQATKEAITDLGITQAILTGQADVVPDSIDDYLKSQNMTTQRFGGDSRYDTCKIIAEDAINKKGLEKTTICVAVGENFPDALTLGPLAGKNKSVILLTRTEFIPQSIKEFITEHKDSIWTVYIAGSADVVSTQVEEEIKNIVGI